MVGLDMNCLGEDNIGRITNRDSARNLISDRRKTEGWRLAYSQIIACIRKQIETRTKPKKFKRRKKKTNLISQPQLSLIQLHTPTNTFCNAKTLIIQFARKLQTHSAQTRAARGVDPQTRCKFCDDIVKVPCFESGRWCLCTWQARDVSDESEMSKKNKRKRREETSKESDPTIRLPQCLVCP